MDSKLRKQLFILVSLSLFILSSCKKEEEDEFDRKAMLTNISSDVVQASYTDLNDRLSELAGACSVFIGNPNAVNLNNLHIAFFDAYKRFQHCKMLNFGPFMDYGIKASMNTYPVDTSQVQSNISSGSYTLGSFDNVDAIGFPALDYLLFHASESTIINEFTSDPYATNRKAYLTDLITKMKDEFALVVSNWNNYEVSFIAADGNDVSSSTSLVFNEMVKDMELLKNAKIGIPAGQQTGGQTLPTYVEGYYSQTSIDLALANLEGIQTVFKGATGLGFDDYIKDVEGEEVTTSLTSTINSQFDVVETKLTAIGNPLSEKVNSDPTAVNNAFLEIKKLVTYCKTDVSSTLGLLITFQDNDGD